MTETWFEKILVYGLVLVCIFFAVMGLFQVLKIGRSDFRDNFCWHGREAVLKPELTHGWCLDMCEDSHDFDSCVVDFCNAGYWRCK